MNNFIGDCHPVLIGSLPMDNHQKATELVFKYTPKIPLWVQLPIYSQEGMISQFMPGMPGFTVKDDTFYMDTSSDTFNDDLLAFYETYLAIQEGTSALDHSPFVLDMNTAKGFFVFLDSIRNLSYTPVALKGQITGPVTFTTGVKDENGKAIFYNEQARDAAVKLIAMKARWQTEKLSQFGCPAIVFFDEPALAGFGSSAFISIKHEDVATCFEEVIDAVHEKRGLAGIHVCANADWSLILNSAVDIISFDAYSFFDKFFLYKDQIKNFIESGRTIAWGIVPTMPAEDIERQTADSLVENWESKVSKIKNLGITMDTIVSRSLITPSCGTGSLSLDLAIRVLELTRDVSDKLRKKYL
jgi:methionine synthase II (cobalamin-independent)